MRQALGKGLEALLPRKSEHANNQSSLSRDTQGSSLKIPLTDIRPNRLQPRRKFKAEKLDELAQSIREHGLAQPIIVTRLEGGKYELIAGERRLRASKLAGLTHIEAVVRENVNERQRLALALIENIQRDDLNAVDAARGYQRLIQDHAVSQSQIAQYLGKSKSAVSNTLRLLELPEDILDAVESELISEGHARALLVVSDRTKHSRLCRQIMDRGLSVRETETLARLMESGPQEQKEEHAGHRTSAKPAEVREAEARLTRSLGMKVDIRTRRDGKSGRVAIRFCSLSDFDKLIGKLK
ncbi:MAG: ParB/RepB/Spo0J family partition protein [Elusimicrobiota bacterium]|jgi:ParB family chromosome partitioning protein